MFENYTEKARRTIFFSRYEASQFGSPYIESEHLLLGLLREDKALAAHFLHRHDVVESLREEIAAHAVYPEKPTTSIDLSFTQECKRILAFGAEESLRLQHKHIGTEHLFLGILREPQSFAARLLTERGIRLDLARLEINEDAKKSEISGMRFGEAKSGQQISEAVAEALHHRLKSGIGLTESGPNQFLLSYHNSSLIPRIGERIAILSEDQRKRTFRVVDLEWGFDQAGGMAQLSAVRIQVTLEK
jgi:ATP-dependent Clp protease ATP-binding subunit ClpA